MAAAERRDGFQVAGQVAGMLPRGDRFAPGARGAGGVRGRDPDFQVQPHRIGPLAEPFQRGGVERRVDRRCVEDLHAVEPSLDGQVEHPVGGQTAMSDRIMVDTDQHDIRICS